MALSVFGLRNASLYVTVAVLAVRTAGFVSLPGVCVSSSCLSGPKTCRSGVRSLLIFIILGCCIRAEDVQVCSHTTALLMFTTSGFLDDMMVIYYNTDDIVYNKNHSEVPLCSEPVPEGHKIHLCKMGDGKTLRCGIQNVTNTDAGQYELEYGGSSYIVNLQVRECATQKTSTKTPDLLQNAQSSTTNSAPNTTASQRGALAAAVAVLLISWLLWTMQ
ncbi:uncharacterized protein LOC120540145 [Polypterus senegalus]|uniref:uncharacterized protein LOC120540145 n=1 Tax=Polypterus senegalus TaxID=55291 RepID=UPI0019648E85|nr:uncharacterized protein LOC120540145 [Polypterus senegalus]XP_039626592.1 uncharacterized protein LOC120540145 [Polypterus senegalus]